MKATLDSDDLDFTHAFDNPKTPAPTLTAASEAQKNEVKAVAVKLQQAGYCINIVRPATKATPPAPGAKRSILCIDDDVPLVQILARKLTLDGYAVRTASDRQSILAELRKLPPPDLILLDVGLPGISGFDLLHKLRQHPQLGAVPVIMLTGHVSPEDVLQGMTGGADGYVSKPFQFDALAVAIKTVLGM
jgi:two-component system, OmpR family, response regulator